MRLTTLQDNWLQWYKLNRQASTYLDVQSCLVALTEHFGSLDLTKLRPEDIESYKAKRVALVKKRTVNKELTYFSGFLAWAVDFGHLKPLGFRIRKFDKVRAPIPVLPTPAEIEAIIAALDPEYRPILLLLYDTGLRVSEALALRAEDVHIEQGCFRVLGKGNKERMVPLTTDRLVQALQGCLTLCPTGYLFVNPITKKPYCSLRKALTRAAAKAGVSVRVTHHVFRHGFGTYGLAAGIGMRAIQGILGHASIKTTERYAHILDSYLQTEGRKFNAYLTEKTSKVG